MQEFRFLRIARHSEAAIVFNGCDKEALRFVEILMIGNVPETGHERFCSPYFFQ